MTGRHVVMGTSRRRGLTAVVAMVGIGLAITGGILSRSGSAYSASNPSDLTAAGTASGVVTHDSAAGAAAFGAWRGSPVQEATAYLGTDSWSNLTGVQKLGLTSYWDSTDYHMVWSVPLIPTDGVSTLAAAATGAYNDKYRTIAQGLVAGGDGDATLRLGWEAGGEWFVWAGHNDPADYAAAYRQAVTSMRSVAGAHFTFDFNWAMNRLDPNALYPGDAYVDYVGTDVYDVSYAWDYTAQDHAQVWNQILTQTGGLNFIANFAAQHGKRISIPEWGLQKRCDGHGGGDDPYFVDQMHAWIASHNVAYEAYFDHDMSSCEQESITSGNHFPKAAAEYQRLWSSPFGTTTTSGAAPTTSPTKASPVPTSKKPTPAPTSKKPTPAPTSKKPTPAPTSKKPTLPPGATPVTWLDHTPIKLSYRPNRSGAVVLQGRRVTQGPVYIFVTPPKGTKKIAFYWEPPTNADPSTVRPLFVEKDAPWDFGGTAASGNANGLNPWSVPHGQHVLLVWMYDAAGHITASNAFFTT